MTPTKGDALVIPRLSAPLTKLIRTGEGIVLFAFNLAAMLGALVNDVSPSTAIKYAAIFNAVAFASRTFLKAVAAGKPVIGAPLEPAVLGQIEKAEPAVATGIEDILEEIKATPEHDHEPTGVDIAPAKDPAPATPIAAAAADPAAVEKLRAQLVASGQTPQA